MTDDIVERLRATCAHLHARAKVLSDLGQEEDTVLMMSALAVTMEAVRAIGQTVNQLSGPQGLGAAGDGT